MALETLFDFCEILRQRKNTEKAAKTVLGARLLYATIMALARSTDANVVCVAVKTMQIIKTVQARIISFLDGGGSVVK